MLTLIRRRISLYAVLRYRGLSALADLTLLNDLPLPPQLNTYINSQADPEFLLHSTIHVVSS